jgi:hypothetical protein
MKEPDMCRRPKAITPSAVLVSIATACTLMVVDARAYFDEKSATVEAIKADLEKAKETYRAKIAQIKVEVILSVGAKIAAGRKMKGNRAIVERLTAEKHDFDKDVNRIPPSLGKDKILFAKRKLHALVALDTAYTRAVKACTEAAQDPQAVALKAEQAEFRSDNAAATSFQRTPQDIVEQQVPASMPRPLMIYPGVLVHSEWNFTRRGVINQSGAFKILDGVIYHLGADNPIGQAALDPAGRLHLSFLGHRKIAEGEAVVEKVANGEFRGVLVFLGDQWGFSMSRR